MYQKTLEIITKHNPIKNWENKINKNSNLIQTVCIQTVIIIQKLICIFNELLSSNAIGRIYRSDVSMGKKK